MDSDGFIYVKYSKKKKSREKALTNNKKLSKIISNFSQCDITTDYKNDKIDYDKDTALRKIKFAVERMEKSEYFITSIETIRESLSKGLTKSLEDTCLIVCYGLGSLCRTSKSIDQFSYLVCLQKLLNVSVELYDPVFTDDDKSIISENYNFNVLEINEEGRRTVNQLTLFYLPHCEHELTNELLYANWNPKNLQNCIIISNGFTLVLEGHRNNRTTFFYINKAIKITKEYVLRNNFFIYDVFNDLSAHVFPTTKLDALEENFWEKWQVKEKMNE